MALWKKKYGEAEYASDIIGVEWEGKLVRKACLLVKAAQLGTECNRFFFIGNKEHS